MRLLVATLVAIQVLLLHQVGASSRHSSQSELINHYKNNKCSKWCPSGRECVIQDGKEVCVCLLKCPSRHKPVCGSDGKPYENHCELHRTACVTKTKIKIDWGNRCIKIQEDHRDSQVMEKENEQDVSQDKHPRQDINVEVFREKSKQPMAIDSSKSHKESEDDTKLTQDTGVKQNMNLFFAFGDDGIHVIDPEKMSLVKHISANEVVGGYQSTICTGSLPKSCTWGGAVNAGSKKIFAADSSGRRLIIIDIKTLSVVEAIETEGHPYNPQYVETLDEIWFTGLATAADILTEGEGDNGTIYVVSKATQKGPHYITKVLSKEAHSIYGLHVTDSCHTRDEERFGYVTHLDEPGFHEVSLKEKKITRFVNLTNQGCHGTYGFALSVTTDHATAHCYTAKDGGQRGQFIVHLKTEEVVAMTTVNIGIPHISPDGRFVVTLNEYTISTVYLNHDGTIEMGQPIKTSMLLSDVAFIPRDYGYDVYVTTKDSQSIVVLHVNPSGMKTLDVLTDVGTPIKEKDWVHTKRSIVIGCDGHAHFLATPATAEDAVIIIDGQQLSVKGKINNVKGVTALVWVGEEDV